MVGVESGLGGIQPSVESERARNVSNLGSGLMEMRMNEGVEEGTVGTAGDPERGSLVVQTPDSLLCEMFRHLPGFALQLVLGFLTYLLNQITEGQGSISELPPETGWMDTCGGPELCSQFA